MKERKVTLPELMLVAATRAMLGAGIGLLVAGLMSNPVRLAVGWTLTVVGVILTVPILMEIFGKKQP